LQCINYNKWTKRSLFKAVLLDFKYFKYFKIFNLKKKIINVLIKFKLIIKKTKKQLSKTFIHYLKKIGYIEQIMRITKQSIVKK